MRILLDTSVLIDNVQPDGDHEYAVSVVSLAELHFGVLRAAGSAHLAERLRRLTEIEHRFTPIPVDRRVAIAYGECADAVAERGRNLRPRSFDLLIAATARVEGVPLATLNHEDFRGLEHLVEVIAPPRDTAPSRHS